MPVIPRRLLQYAMYQIRNASLWSEHFGVEDRRVDHALRKYTLIQSGAWTYVLANVDDRIWIGRCGHLRIEDRAEDFWEVIVHGVVVIEPGWRVAHQIYSLFW